jgi:bifunctional UDP-N-acetylglucosamine pyrophosphorylase/glucosamine-1-phosphate N-acetyltransferase
MLNGDTIVSAKDIKKVITNGANIALGVIEVRNPGDYDIVDIKEDKIEKIHKKMKYSIQNLVKNAGVYSLDERIFEVLPKTDKSKRGEFELPDSLQLLIESGEAIFWKRIGYWIDVVYPWNLLTANDFLIEKVSPANRGELEENVMVEGNVSIGEGTVIKSGTYIEGPVFIGDNCVIGPNSYIRANTSIGDNCHIEYAVEVKNSVIMDNTKILPHNYIDDSVIGCRCNLGAGTKIANLRFDDAPVIAKGVDTGRRKLGAIISDGVKTGINACIDAGTIIGNNTLIGPGAFASGNIEKNSRIY